MIFNQIASSRFTAFCKAIVFVPRPRKAERGIWKCLASVHPRYVVSALKIFICWPIDFKLHTSIILGISSLSSKLDKIRKKMWEGRPFLRCLPKHIKISKCYNFNENWYLEDCRPEECDSDKCDLKMAAIAAIMVLQCSNYKEN